jgi:hypothetical protein
LASPIDLDGKTEDKCGTFGTVFQDFCRYSKSIFLLAVYVTARPNTPLAKMTNSEEDGVMAKYLISFPGAAMVVPDGDWEAVGRDAHAVIDEAKVAGVYVFAGGIDENVPPVLVSTDGTVAEGGYPWAPELNGGFTILDLPSRDQAVAWAARIAKACRCDQELRIFQFDPQV